MSDELELGRYNANSHTNQGEGANSLIRVRNKDVADTQILLDSDSDSTKALVHINAAGGQVVIDTDACKGKIVSLRQVTGCKSDGTKQYAIVLMSAWQDDPFEE